ncbi:hypothetical protein CWI38_0874p0010 [Hamiltosporidium tvaerminnensis]|uniref:Uncharacterized protein n=1 Tax=Hamiltosporidium tvaerminnensis TaxID=1176355 RepID=A0A4Q9LU51_9MICR|nr:hypothetical protein CWI38_0874p0010 [Hamiltosporidium tvaerminnensis]
MNILLQFFIVYTANRFQNRRIENDGCEGIHAPFSRRQSVTSRGICTTGTDQMRYQCTLGGNGQRIYRNKNYFHGGREEKTDYRSDVRGRDTYHRDTEKTRFVPYTNSSRSSEGQMTGVKEPGNRKNEDSRETMLHSDVQPRVDETRFVFYNNSTRSSGRQMTGVKERGNREYQHSRETMLHSDVQPRVDETRFVYIRNSTYLKAGNEHKTPEREFICLESGLPETRESESGRFHKENKPSYSGLSATINQSESHISSYKNPCSHNFTQNEVNFIPKSKHTNRNENENHGGFINYLCDKFYDEPISSHESSLNESVYHERSEDHRKIIMAWITDIFASTKELKDVSVVQEILKSLKETTNIKDFLQRIDIKLIELDNLLNAVKFEFKYGAKFFQDEIECKSKLIKILNEKFQKKIYCEFPELEKIICFFKRRYSSDKINFKCILPILCLIQLNNSGCKKYEGHANDYFLLGGRYRIFYIVSYIQVIRDLFFSLSPTQDILPKNQNIIKSFMENFSFISSSQEIIEDSCVFELCLFIYSNVFCFVETKELNDWENEYLNLLNSINEAVYGYKIDDKVDIQELYKNIYIIFEQNLSIFKFLLRKLILFHGFRSDDPRYKIIINWAYSTDKENESVSTIFKYIHEFNICCVVFNRSKYAPIFNHIALEKASLFMQSYNLIQ